MREKRNVKMNMKIYWISINDNLKRVVIKLVKKNYLFL